MKLYRKIDIKKDGIIEDIMLYDFLNLIDAAKTNIKTQYPDVDLNNVRLVFDKDDMYGAYNLTLEFYSEETADEKERRLKKEFERREYEVKDMLKKIQTFVKNYPETTDAISSMLNT
jgi:hypothetical protein